MNHNIENTKSMTAEMFFAKEEWLELIDLVQDAISIRHNILLEIEDLQVDGNTLYLELVNEGEWVWATIVHTIDMRTIRIPRDLFKHADSIIQAVENDIGLPTATTTIESAEDMKLDTVSDFIEVDIDTHIGVSEDGAIEYLEPNDKLTWADSPYSDDGLWYGTDTGVYLADRVEVLERIDQLLEENVSKLNRGVIHLNGTATLVYNISNRYYYTDEFDEAQIDESMMETEFDLDKSSIVIIQDI